MTTKKYRKDAHQAMGPGDPEDGRGTVVGGEPSTHGRREQLSKNDNENHLLKRELKKRNV